MRFRHRPTPSPNCKLQIANCNSAFTLIELLVVLGIIVVVALLTIPVLNVLQGNRSSDAAQNQLQALINQARMNAIGLQRDSGVMFYIDPSTKRINTVLVQGTDSLPGDPNVDDILDLVRDHESVPLTLGLSLQTIDNATVVPGTPPTRGDDGYIGFNTDNSATPNTIAYGGVILFDAHGQLVSRTYGFRTNGDMGRLLFLNSPPPSFYIPGGGTIPPPQSAFGLVLFSSETFHGQDFTDSDAQDAGGGFNNVAGATLAAYAGPEAAEEDWIDKNSIPLMVNRYNGTLIRGE